jgi:hypothetical protein
MFELSEIPGHQRSSDGQLFHSLRQQASLKVSVPDELREKVEAQLENLFSAAGEQIDDSRTFYRARIHEFNQIAPFLKEEMGAPSGDKANLGRMQLAGHPMLYTATQAETTIAEVRPSYGNLVSIAEFSVKAGCVLKILNLVQYEKPAINDGPDAFIPSVLKIANSMRFSEREFSRQMHENDPTRYLDTIYITQIIREKGFDGIAFRSLMNKGGVNYAFFNPECFRCVAVPVVWKVTSAEYQAEQDK